MCFVARIYASTKTPDHTICLYYSLFLDSSVLFAVLQGALYARKEFGWAAFAITAYHVGIIIGAIATSLMGEYFLGVYGLAFGVILGAVGQIGLLLPGLRKQRLSYMFVLDLKNSCNQKYFKVIYSNLL